jgi:PAS domain S-box-containing protein
VKLTFRLAQKGLVLVLIPLVFQVFFVTILAVLLHEAEVQTEREYKTKLMVAEASEIGRSFFDLLRTITLAKVTGSGSDKRYNGIITQIKEHERKLLELGGENFREQESIRRITLLTEQELLLMDELKHQLESKEHPFEIYDEGPLKKKMFAISNLILAESEELTAETMLIQQKTPEAAKMAKNMVKGTLLAILLFNVLLSVVLAHFFGKGITSRLAVLTDNSNRLAADKPLNQELSGDDEIASLDKTFHQMARALSEAARKERALVDNAEDVICSLNSAGKFTKINPASDRLWGYPPGSLINRYFFDLVARDDQEQTEKWFQRVKTGEPVPPLENKIICKNRTLINMLWSAHWSDAEDTLFCVAHDFTARKELEQRKAELVSMVSHDLRSPLGAIANYLALLPTGAIGSLNDKGERLTKNAQRSCQRLMALINDLLDLERLESGEMPMEFSTVSINDVLQRSVETLERLAEDQNVSLRAEETDITVHADGNRLIQVMVNLIANAIKYSPPAGIVTCSASRATTDGFITVKVCDQGRGIPPHMIGSVFERFKQVEIADATKKGGTGLGLAICKAIVEQHKGTIGVESVEGNGSTFWFTLPANQVEAAALATPDSSIISL